MQYLLFLSVSFFWGINFWLMKNAIVVFSPVGVAAIRVLSGAVFLAIVVAFRERKWPFKRSDIPCLALIIAVGYTWPFIIQPYLIHFCGSGVIGLMPSLVPLITILLSIPLLNIRPSTREFTGVLIGLGFIGLLFIDGMHREIDTAHLFLAATVPLSYAISNTMVKRVYTKVSPVMLTFICLLTTSVLLMPYALLEASPSTMTINDPTAVTIAWVSVISLGVFGTGIALLCFTIMIQRRGPLFAGMVTYVIPVIALIAGGIDGEYISPLQIIALVGILLMVAIVQWPASIRKTAATGPG